MAEASRSVTDGTMDELGAALAELAAARERVRELEDSVQKLIDSMERLDWREGVCCCGSPMEHSAWEGHTPVDMGEYHHGSIVDEAKQRLAAPTSAAHTGEEQERFACGCVTCVCDDPVQCYGCGAKRCGKSEAECEWLHSGERAATDTGEG